MTNQLFSPFKAEQYFLKTAIKSGNLCFLKVYKKCIYFTYILFNPLKNSSEYVCFVDITFIFPLKSFLNLFW